VSSPLTLAIISYPSRLEETFERMAARCAPGIGAGFALERCQEPPEVLFLANRWKNRGYSIERLDLYGHGDGGRFRLGDGLLFASDGTGYHLARRLGPTLAPRADLRLLGCRTGTSRRGLPFSGPKLLRDLERLLGRGRRAWGTTGSIGPAQCGPGGLTDAAEALLRRARAGGGLRRRNASLSSGDDAARLHGGAGEKDT
jgi:hypothetical protein